LTLGTKNVADLEDSRGGHSPAESTSPVLGKELWEAASENEIWVYLTPHRFY